MATKALDKKRYKVRFDGYFGVNAASADGAENVLAAVLASIADPDVTAYGRPIGKAEEQS